MEKAGKVFGKGRNRCIKSLALKCRTFFVPSHRARDKNLFVSQRVAGGEKRSDVKKTMSDVEKTTSDIVFVSANMT